MRFFRREIEVALKVMGIVTLVALIVLPIAWGYEQRRQARAWQNVACAYRIKEVLRSTRGVTNMDRGAEPCAVLESLGLTHSETDGRREADLVIVPTTGNGISTRTRPVSR